MKSHSTDGTLMQRLALVRLRRFERVAAAAEQSESPIWQRLARQAARNAYRDVLLAGLSSQAGQVTTSGPETRAA